MLTEQGLEFKNYFEKCLRGRFLILFHRIDCVSKSHFIKTYQKFAYIFRIRFVSISFLRRKKKDRKKKKTRKFQQLMKCNVCINSLVMCGEWPESIASFMDFLMASTLVCNLS